MLNRNMIADRLLLEKCYSQVLNPLRCDCCNCVLTTEEINNNNKIILEAKESVAKGVIIYHGVSRNQNIICIATGIDGSSKNVKTGAMIQTHIINADIDPATAAMAGKDVSICGDCILRKKKICYVNKGQGPKQVYKAYHNNSYLPIFPINKEPSTEAENESRFKGKTPEEITQIYLREGNWDIFAGKYVRFGSYGDPTVIPFQILEKIATTCAGFTGYTHQWKNPAFAGYKKYIMASVDFPSDYELANKQGWRTFRVTHNWRSKALNEEPCENAIDGTQCIDCLKCCGTTINSKNIYTKVHGKPSDVNNFVKNFGEIQYPDHISPEELQTIEKIEAREERLAKGNVKIDKIKNLNVNKHLFG